MRLVGRLSNPANQSVMRVLAFAEEFSAPPPIVRGPRARRLGNGAIQRAGARVLADSRSMKLADIREAIERLLGQPVSYASVEWCMRMSVRGSAPWAVRIRLGWYRLRHE